MHCKRWSLLVVCLATLCLFPWGRALAEPGWDPKGVAQKAVDLFKKDDFAGLEAMVSEIKKKGYDIRQTHTELGAFYSVFALKETDSERQCLDRQTKLEGWSAAVPDSLSAKIVMANWYIEYGWKARGNGYADSVTPEGWKLFAERLASAAEILKSVPPEKIDDPEYYHLWMTLSRGQDLPPAEMNHYFHKGTELAKGFFPLYSAKSVYLLPRWHGDQKDCARFATEAAATMPGDKGEILYALLARSEAHFYDDDYFTQSPVDYERIKNAFLAEEQRNGPTKVTVQNDLCYLAAIKGDKETAKRLFLDLGSAAETDRFGGQVAYLRLRKASGAEESVDQALAAERAGKLDEAEKLWTSFHPEDDMNSWLVYFYERQGMEAKLRGVHLKNDEVPSQVLDTDVANANPDVLAVLSRICPELGNWEKAEAAAQAFNKKRPWNLTGKNTLCLCALHRGDKEQAKAVLKEFVSLKTDRPAYQIAQAVLSGEKPWGNEVLETLKALGVPKDFTKLKTGDSYTPQAATAIVLYYLAQGDTQTAQKVIEETIPLCRDDTARTLLESMLYGSLSRSLMAAR